MSNPAAPLGSAASEPSPAKLPLLGPDDPPPFEILNPDGAARVVLIADHAGRAIPAALNNLGLDEAALARHIAWDIGIADVTCRLSERLDAPAVLCGYSRLVIDCNRQLEDPSSIAQVSDGIDVPGNRGLTAAQRTQRAEACFHPYHEAVGRLIEGRRKTGVAPAILSMHSFTPVFGGVERPWHVGVLWNRDPRLPVPLMERLRADPAALCIGDNEPYSGRDEHGYSIHVHGEALGLAHVLIELRQDLIDTRRGAAEWAERLAGAFQDILVDEEIFRVVHR